MHKIKNSIFLLFLFNQLISQVTLVKDINPGSNSSFINSLSKVVNDKCYFVADDNKNGHEIWITDGTSSGTKLVKNIYPGSETCDPRAFGSNSNQLFFIANDSTHGLELWSTSGDETNTKLIFDSNPGSGKTSITIPFTDSETFINIEEKVYIILIK
jgi:ELWxxDGT repeat protein